MNTYLHRYWYPIALGVLMVAALFFHAFQLSTLPSGLYTDEASIGVNAAAIAETGRDEHGVAWPVFFEAFGEYKNPLYIYTTAALFSVFGTSEVVLRATSALYFFAFLAVLYFLLRAMFTDRRVILYGVATAVLLPWFFAMSRVSFEVISQLSVTTGAFLCIYRAFERPGKYAHCYAAGAGLLLGLSLYAYTTSRILGY